MQPRRRIAHALEGRREDAAQKSKALGFIVHPRCCTCVSIGEVLHFHASEGVRSKRRKSIWRSIGGSYFEGLTVRHSCWTVSVQSQSDLTSR